MEHKTNDITLMLGHGGHNTLAHEQLARDEQFVGVFFASFAIQYFSQKDKKFDVREIKFLDFFKDIELYVSQRAFVKNMIESKNFKKICDELSHLITKPNLDKTPYDAFLSTINKGNKGFLIRQIFFHTDQVLEKYRFISDFLNKPMSQIDIDDLFKKMWHLDIEQQILVCVCIFSRLVDNYDSEKKSIGASYNEKAKKLHTQGVAEKNEEFVGIFFAAFAIQFYLHKDFHSIKITSVEYLDQFKNIDIYASQRVFIKNIISNKKYKILCEEIKYLLIEHNSKKELAPHQIFLSRINKEAELKQLFSPVSSSSDKYRFIREIEKKGISDINMEELYSKMWHLSIEQQILICIYLFSKFTDQYESKKKSIKESFLENATKIREIFVAMGKSNTVEVKNFDLFIDTFKN